MSVTETSRPLPRVEKLDPQLQHQLHNKFADFLHESLFVPNENDVWGDDDYVIPVEPDQYTPEQLGTSEVVSNHLLRATAVLDETIASLTPEEQAGDLPLYQIMVRAQEKTMQAAVAAKAENQPAKAVESIETFLVLNALTPNDNPFFTLSEEERTTELVLDAVAEGLAKEIVQAGQNTVGLVCTNLSSKENQLTAVGGILVDNIALLQLASDLKFTSGFKDAEPLMGPGLPPEDIAYRTELLENLRAKQLVVLAKQTLAEKHNVSQAAALAVEALIAVSEEPPSRVESDASFTKTITDAFDLVQATKGASSEDFIGQLEDAMAQMQHYREPGSNHRGNKDTPVSLDRALVTLVHQGRMDIAERLISPSYKEIGNPGKDNLSHEVDYVLKDFPEDIERVKQAIHQVRSKKIQTFTAALEEKGLGKDVELILSSASDPELALTLSKSDVELLNQLNVKIKSEILVFGRHDAIPRFIAAHQKLQAAGFEDKAAFLDTFLDYQIYEEPENYFEKSLQLYQEMKDFPAEEGSESAFQKHFKTLLQKGYGDPAEVWRFGKELYGDKVVELLDQLTMILPRDLELNQELKTIITNITHNVLPVIAASSFANGLSLERLRTISEIDGKKLEAAVQRTATETLGVPFYYRLIDRISNHAEPGQAIDRILNASDEILNLMSEDMLDPVRLDLVSGLLDGELTNENLGSMQDLIGKLSEPLLQNPNLDSAHKRQFFLYIVGFDSEGRDQLVNCLSATFDLFGEFISLESLEVVHSIMKGDELSDSLREIGVTKNGEAGIEQLKAAFQKVTQSIFESGELHAGIIVRDFYIRDFVKKTIRFEQSSFGNHQDQEFLRILSTALRVDAKTDERYNIGEVSVKTLDTKAVESFQVSEDGVEEWRRYAEAVRNALDIVPPVGQINWQRFGQLLTDVQETVYERNEQMSNGITKLRGKIDTFIAEQKDVSKLQSQLEKQEELQRRLSDIDFTMVTDLDITKLCEQVVELSSHNSIAGTGLVQTLLSSVALMQTRSEEINVPSLRLADPAATPSLQDIQEMADFIGHTTNIETWREKFDAVGGQKQLDKLLSIDALNENITRGNNLDTAGTTSFRFIPTRGPLLELSGHIADACWASHYDSIAEQFPNITSVIMVQNPDKASRKLAGAALLIETVSNQGDPLLVIRGLNPIQNTITQLSQESFTTEFLGYVRPIAESLGRKLAIVIDDHAGGSATNRPPLFDYLSGRLKPTLQKVQLMSEQDTTFNRYNIVNDTYLV